MWARTLGLIAVQKNFHSSLRAIPLVFSTSRSRWRSARGTLRLCSVNKPSTMALFCGLLQVACYYATVLLRAARFLKWTSFVLIHFSWDLQAAQNASVVPNNHVYQNMMCLFHSYKSLFVSGNGRRSGTRCSRGPAGPHKYGSIQSAWIWCIATSVAIAAVACDASQCLVITVRNKLLHSQYIHSPPGGGKNQSLLRLPLKVQWKKKKSIRNPVAQVIAYFVLLCYFLTVP